MNSECTSWSSLRRRVRRQGAVVSFVLALALMAGCGGQGSDSSSAVESDDRYDLAGQKVRIGTAAEQTLDIGTSYAIELLKGWGADVQREELTDVSGLEAIVADRIDVSARSSDEVIDGQSRGVDIVAFGAPASVMHYVVLGDPDIKDISGLKGKSVATSGPGGFDTILFQALLNKEGLTLGEDVKNIPIGGSGERTAAVLASQADASMVFLDDWLSLEGRTEDVGLVGYVAKMIPGLSSRTLAAPRDFLEGHHELIVAMACANLEANAWINDEPDAYAKFTASRVTGVSEDDVKKFRDEAVALGMFPTAPEDVLSLESYEKTAQLMSDGGLLKKPVDVKSAVDTSFMEEAAAAGCGKGA